MACAKFMACCKSMKYFSLKQNEEVGFMRKKVNKIAMWAKILDQWERSTFT